jgi:hypothetical protein
VFVVKGRPGLFTKIKVALAQARGHDAWDVERTDKRVTCGGRRRGWPQERFVEISVTIEEATTAGWTSNEAYEKTPADMLWSRAMSRVLDRIAADVLFGIASIEDLEVDDAPTPDRPTVAAAVGAALAEKPAGAGSARLRELVQQKGNEPDPSTSSDVRDVEPSPPIEQTDWRRLMARFNELGVNGLGRDVRRLKVMSHIVGRDIAKGSELSKDEAQLILDNLAGAAGVRLVAEVEDIVDPAVVNRGDDEPRAATQDEVESEADELTADDVPEPGEGRPAALEGGRDPWGDPS